jgi:hypothetical protein
MNKLISFFSLQYWMSIEIRKQMRLNRELEERQRRDLEKELPPPNPEVTLSSPLSYPLNWS